MTVGHNNQPTLEALIIGTSEGAVRLRDMIRRVARSNASVMLCGPSGSGKELVARAIHDEGTRAGKAFSAINCGAIPGELIESELFGHEKGSFTGAHARRIGHFEASEGGTIFLDEIGDMRFDMQVKLLRVLEDRTIVRVGSSEVKPVDVRVISATHQDLGAAIAEGKFREDLFFRLGVVVLQVPSLASRAEDIPALIRHFQRKMPVDAKCRFDAGAMAMLMQHRWPGNVRELRNFVERASVLHGGETLDAQDVAMLLNPTATPAPRPAVPGGIAAVQASADDRPVPQPAAAVAKTPAPGRPIDLKREIETIELEQIHVALDLADGIISEAARLLTLKRTTLIEKMRKYGVHQQAA
ncbi:sigma-54 interaction domain-containing protein [Sphingopyxis alaskensis]|jgi:sigma-54 specific flagellar transcriptional regulator A|uniref:Sigma54 specific transcriptional regulator, Fis family n=1 Tax=Sphingopyxis alaskensis (strain DSM 13593 / LMG 18877 / RB2256) TaxID=317655 RepID=Q1GNZ7_SPHAL|nr:sigma-54 dependent transcriptional regulator [Sphingopyxis alaskensis]ABF54625.1 sigma54 specific transcriptional regulator, Fis family [Sphingopyxis alaskensis RB2256]MCM3418534.1 sigma-54 dependent transcriptional regulator [Sphingopyxis alaskensis]